MEEEEEDLVEEEVDVVGEVVTSTGGVVVIVGVEEVVVVALEVDRETEKAAFKDRSVFKAAYFAIHATK